MKTGLEALSTAENVSGSIKHENGTRRPRYRRKRIRGCKTLKRDPKPPELPNTSLSAQNKKTGLDAHGTTENKFGSAKHENWTRRPRYRRKYVQERKSWKRDPTPSVPPKMSPGAQIMKSGSDALGIPKKSPGAQNMKTGPEALGTVENESGSVKKENGTQRPRYRRKRVRVRKNRKRDPPPLSHPKQIPECQNMKTGPNALGTAEN
jgi:hypothetical protein